jgi:hypothetical protein
MAFTSPFFQSTQAQSIIDGYLNNGGFSQPYTSPSTNPYVVCSTPYVPPASHSLLLIIHKIPLLLIVKNYILVKVESMIQFFKRVFYNKNKIMITITKLQNFMKVILFYLWQMILLIQS